MARSQKIDNAEPMDIATIYFPKIYFNVILLYLHEGFYLFIYFVYLFIYFVYLFCIFILFIYLFCIFYLFIYFIYLFLYVHMLVCSYQVLRKSI